MGYEKCYKDLIVYGIYGALNIVRYRDRPNDQKIYKKTVIINLILYLIKASIWCIYGHKID
jgi:hypothetical protein